MCSLHGHAEQYGGFTLTHRGHAAWQTVTPDDARGDGRIPVSISVKSVNRGFASIESL